jgi:hypothetical protein
MTTLEKLQPYVEHLFDDGEVQDHLSRAAANLRGARVQAGRAKSKRKAATDPKLRARLLSSAGAAVDAGVAISRGPEKRKRRSRRSWLLILAGVGAAGYLAYDESARAQLLGLIGADDASEKGGA